MNGGKDELIDRPFCRNSEEIAEYLGTSVKSVHTLRKDHGLPIFKIGGRGNWKGIKSSLDDWFVEMEKRNIKIK